MPREPPAPEAGLGRGQVALACVLGTEDERRSRPGSRALKSCGMHLLPALAGIWLMMSPAVLGYADPARANDRIIGPIVASLATIAMWEVSRPLRWVNVVLGAWLLVAPWLLGHIRPLVAGIAWLQERSFSACRW